MAFRRFSSMPFRVLSALAVIVAFDFGGEFSRRSAYAFTTTKVALPSNDIGFDPFTGKIFATVPSTAGARGNSVTPIDPVTGTLGNSVFVGSEPTKIAIADNGQYLYVGLNGAAAVRRFDIASQTAGLQFSLGNGSFGALLAEDIEVLPGQANAVAVSRRNTCCSPRHEGVGIYADGVLLTNKTPGHTGSNVIDFSESSGTLYGYNNETTDFGLRRMSVDSSGVQTTNSTGGVISGFGTDIEFAGGRIYSTTGKIVDAATMTLVGTFPKSGPVFPDPAGGQVYFLSSNTLFSYDLNTFLLNWSYLVPGASNSTGRLIRFGDHGLAFRTSTEVVLVTDPKIGGVPEPTTIGLMSLAAAAMILVRRRPLG